MDFGFAFGRCPEIDAPGLFVPNAVFLALGEARWAQARRLWDRSGSWDCTLWVSKIVGILLGAELASYQ